MIRHRRQSPAGSLANGIRHGPAIANALDADAKDGERSHARAAKAGLTAIEETRDFVPADAPLQEVVDLVVRGRHTSLPVYREEVDDVVGIMLVTDLVRTLAAPPHAFSVAGIAREALTVPETMKADELLRQMRRHRSEAFASLRQDLKNVPVCARHDFEHAPDVLL
jgi:CBS domain-containing protein